LINANISVNEQPEWFHWAHRRWPFAKSETRCAFDGKHILHPIRHMFVHFEFVVLTSLGKKPKKNLPAINFT
jgi:hypothetical protein